LESVLLALHMEHELLEKNQLTYHRFTDNVLLS
jgi:hypothetical protein